ncbi:leucine--tRNA ligase [Candidatus Curtissbacteria bacterium]|nr:leucine--tRNA ligase [Candidatus Curtissbacteria bacterium]
MSKYIPKSLEKNWQKKWHEAGLYKVDLTDSKKKYYLLVELPYPSGDLHMGHWFTFAVTDILGRLKRMQGYNVFFPVGFDAFGLPAENAAIKRGINPRDWTYGNIETMKKQFATMGGMHDFEHGVITCDPEYYRWNQWIFIKMLEKGLAYRGKILSNWCPKDQTVLANENVEAGRCWRCGTEVVQKEVDQWMLKITDYADRLLWEDKQNFVLLHGFTGRPDKNFFPWLKEALETKGYRVQVPALPDPDDADPMEQIKYVLENCDFDQNTVLLGHSLGAVVAMKVTEALKTKIAGLVLVAPFIEPKFRDHPRPFEKKFNWEFDFKKIKSNISSAITVGDIDDSAVAPAHVKKAAEVLGAELVMVKPNIDHFTGHQEPEVLKQLLSLNKTSQIDWPQPVREGQNNWIGKSEGVIIKFKVKDSSEVIEVFTTRPDTLWGATFIVLAPELDLVFKITTSDKTKEVTAYQEKAVKKSEMERKENKEKTGVFTGAYAINPLNGNEIPVWIADYALAQYGTGSLFGDAHDDRDVEFAKKYGIALTPTVITGDVERDARIKNKEEVFTGYGTLIESGKYTGMSSVEAKRAVIADLVHAKSAEVFVNYHLHDWSISRQRYWGTPIPVIHCQKCGTVPVPEKDLPVVLPEIKDYSPQGKPPLAAAEEWVNVKCPNCAGDAKREVDTMDTFVDSAWYFLRYVDPKNEREIFNKQLVSRWAPVELYIGGAEHTLGHTLYSRFFVKFLHDIGVVPFDEYAKKRVHHGVILGPDGARMSKSHGNVVNPDEQVDQFGADAVRMYLAFLGPYDLVAPWNPTGIRGVYHFLQRVWELNEKVDGYQSTVEGKSKKTVNRKSITHNLSAADLFWMHKTIKKVGEDVSSIKYNTAVAALMEWLNYLSRKAHGGKILHDEYETLLLLVAPFAPHMTEELWQKSHSFTHFDAENSVHKQAWPVFQEQYIKEEKVIIVVQINGKVRENVEVETGADQVAVEKLARASEKIQNYLTGEPKKVIFVPGKLLNFVI